MHSDNFFFNVISFVAIGQTAARVRRGGGGHFNTASRLAFTWEGDYWVNGWLLNVEIKMEISFEGR